MPRPWQTLSKPWVTVAVAPSPDSTHHPELVWVEMQAHCHAVLCRGNAGSGHTTEWPGPPVCHPVITHPGLPCPQPGPRCPGPLRPQWAAHTGCLLQSPGLLFSSASGPSPTPDQLDESPSGGASVLLIPPGDYTVPPGWRSADTVDVETCAKIMASGPIT